MKKMKNGAGRRRDKLRTLRAARTGGKLLTHVAFGAILLVGLLYIEGLLHVVLRKFIHWVNDPVLAGVSEVLETAVLVGDAGLFLWWLMKSLRDAIKEMRE